MPSDAANQWTKFYSTNTEIMYPAEAVIRIFKGEYPHLKMPRPKRDDQILDVGCGDGRHFPLFQQLGLNISASEITEEIVRKLETRWEDVNVRVGTCAALPWRDATFDYVLTWNSCYYMNTDASFPDHVAEMARVTKPGGWIICSVPKPSCFIFRDCEQTSTPGYVLILDEHFGLRNGEIMRRFLSTQELAVEFGRHFTNFCWAKIDIDMFGLAYNWHVFTAERKRP